MKKCSRTKMTCKNHDKAYSFRLIGESRAWICHSCLAEGEDTGIMWGSPQYTLLKRKKEQVPTCHGSSALDSKDREPPCD